MRYLFAFLIFFMAAAALAEDKQFDFKADTQSYTCGFINLRFPSNFSVFAAGAYSGREISFQIDQSGHTATQIDVAVNSSKKPVVLMLGAYEPTVWNIGWSKDTKIFAVLVSGYHRQVVAGLPSHVPLVIRYHDDKSNCGDRFYVSQDQLEKLNPISQKEFGRPVDMVYIVKNGNVVVGDPITAGTKLITSSENPPESYYDRSAPLAGEAGLQDAINKGILRRATDADAEAWAKAVVAKLDVPPVSGGDVLKSYKPAIYDAYVILKPFTYPSGLYGADSADFFLAKGVPKPKGEPGHSTLYDFNTLTCEGATPGCNRAR
jgi:hypothetical protein